VSLPSSLPRRVNLAELRADPLSFLRRARAAGDALVVISEDEAAFSRAGRCAGAVAAFGPAAVREVLGDADRFGMPVSIGEQFALPERLLRLNTGLFSMHGDMHRSRQQLLMSLLGAGRGADYLDGIARGWHAFSAGLAADAPVSLLAEMRRLVLNVSQRVILGSDDLALGRQIQSYFDRRRNLKTTHGRLAHAARGELIRIGGRLDRMLHARLAALRAEAARASDGPMCLLARLLQLEPAGGERLSDDELAAHANVLFMSSSEPVAVALTWTLLLMSQHARLRAALRRELTDAFGAAGVPEQVAEANLPLLHGTIRESLRLLPPNAIMVRLTTQPAAVLGHALPAYCEVVISPYVAQREPDDFADPDVFDPWRWRTLKPSPYAYFPFGVGARYCMGRQLAGHTLLYILARIVERFDVVLAGDQDIDWKMDVTMMPANEPIVQFLSLARDCGPAGRLGGPVAALARIPSPDARAREG
jgi:cytochrome P450